MGGVIVRLILASPSRSGIAHGHDVDFLLPDISLSGTYSLLSYM